MENKEKVNNEEKVEENITPIDFEKAELNVVDTTLNTDDFENVVEQKRLGIHNAYQKARKVSNLMTLAMVAIIIVSIILISQKTDALKYTGYALGGVALVGMLVYYAVNRNKIPDLMKVYMRDVNNLVNAFVYKDQKYGKLTNDMEEKVDMGEVASDRVYTGIKGCGSRNVIHGSYLNNPFMVGDVKIVKLEGKNKEADLFVGKYLSCANGLKFDGRVVLNICLKGQKTYDLPNDVADLDEVEHKDTLTIWATPGLDYKKVLTNEILNKLNKLEVKEDKHLYNVNVVVWGGHTGVYLSYDNSVMSFPFENEFKKSGIERFKADQSLVFEIFEILAKDKVIGKGRASGKAAELVNEEIKEETVEAPVEEIKETVEAEIVETVNDEAVETKVEEVSETVETEEVIKDEEKDKE